MAITFDSTNKIIMLDSFNTSASAIWTAWINWVLLSDNAKYPPAFSQVGGVAPIALYLTLENGWRVRPMEADGITTITGNLLVQGGGSPIASTLGNWQVLVNMETPVAAQAIAVSGSVSSDVNIVSVAGTVVSSVDDFKTTTVNGTSNNGPTKNEIADAVWAKVL